MFEIVNKVTGLVVDTATCAAQAMTVVTARQNKTHQPHFARPAK